MSDTTLRDQLAQIIWDCDDLNRAVLADCEDIAEAILDAGWRPTTGNSEQLSLFDVQPDGTFVPPEAS